MRRLTLMSGWFLITSFVVISINSSQAQEVADGLNCAPEDFTLSAIIEYSADAAGDPTPRAGLAGYLNRMYPGIAASRFDEAGQSNHSEIVFALHEDGPQVLARAQRTSTGGWILTDLAACNAFLKKNR